MLTQIVDLYRVDRVGRCEAEYGSVEIELALEALNNCRSLSEAVLLPYEREVGDRKPFGAQCLGHHLRLVRRDHLVFEPLEQDQRAGQPVDGMDRRALAVDLFRG